MLTLVIVFMMLLVFASCLGVAKGLYDRIRFIATGFLGLFAVVVGGRQRAVAGLTRDAVGAALLILGALALVQLRKMAAELAEDLCGRFPAVFRCLAARRLALLRELAGLIARGDLQCVITGGMAFDARMTGRLTHMPADIDLCCLDEHEMAVREVLAKAGFVLDDRRTHQVMVRRRGDIEVDLFVWRDGDNGMIQYIREAELYQVPRDIFRPGQMVQLEGIPFPTYSDDMFSCIAPMASRRRHREFLQGLSTRMRKTVDGERRTVSVSLRIKVVEFDTRDTVNHSSP